MQCYELSPFKSTSPGTLNLLPGDNISENETTQEQLPRTLAQDLSTACVSSWSIALSEHQPFQPYGGMEPGFPRSHHARLSPNDWLLNDWFPVPRARARARDGSTCRSPESPSQCR